MEHDGIANWFQHLKPLTFPYPQQLIPASQLADFVKQAAKSTLNAEQTCPGYSGYNFSLPVANTPRVRFVK